MRRYSSGEDMIRSNIIIDDNDCWVYQSKSLDPYVSVAPTYWGKAFKVNRAHQLSYKVFKGDYDKKLVICHTCNVKRCVNPDHLYAGTQQDNLRDAFFNDNNNRVPSSVVLEIVYMLSKGSSLSEIRGCIDIPKDKLNNIINGKTYTYVSGIKRGQYRITKRGIVSEGKNWRLIDKDDKERIKRLYESDPEINTMTSIAKFYKISLSYVSRIISGER